MGLPLTPQILAAAYEYLRATPPYNRWKLPPASEVKFRVTRHRDREGDCNDYGNRTEIRVSARVISHTSSLMCVVSHEMIHQYQYGKGVRSAHGAEFRRLAALVSKYHGFDPLPLVGAT